MSELHSIKYRQHSWNNSCCSNFFFVNNDFRFMLQSSFSQNERSDEFFQQKSQVLFWLTMTFSWFYFWFNFKFN